MKKDAIKVISIFIILILPFFVLSALLGDIDGNGKVGSTDYILVRKHLLNTSKLTGDKLKRADVNSDGKVNTKDYIAIRKTILDGSTSTSLSSSSSFEAYFLNTINRSNYSLSYGNNDAFIFKTSNGKYILIDAGKVSKDIKDTIYNELKRLQKTDKVSIDYMIISHMHSDHYGNAVDIINDSDIKINNLIIKKDSAPGTTKKYNEIKNVAKKKKINIVDTNSLNEGDYYELSSNIKMYLFNVKDIYKNVDCSIKHYTISFTGGSDSYKYVKSTNGKYLYIDGKEYKKNGINTVYHESDTVYKDPGKDDKLESKFWVTLSHDDKMISQCNSNSNSLVVVFQYRTSKTNKYVYVPNDLQNDGYSPLGEYDSSLKTTIHGHASTMFYKYKMVNGEPRFYLDNNNKLIVNKEDSKVKKAAAYITAKNIKKKLSDINSNIVIHQMAHHGINGYQEVVNVLGLNSSSTYSISPSESNPASIISLPRADAVNNIKNSKIMYTGYNSQNGVKCIIKDNGSTSCTYY